MLANNTELAEEALRRLRDADDFVYDAETSGLDHRVNHIIGHVLTFGQSPSDSYYLPIRHAGGGNLDGASGVSTLDGWDHKLSSWEVEFHKELKRKPRRMTGHNLQFDLGFLHEQGYSTLGQHYEDTMVNQYLLHENSRRWSLEYIAGLHNVEAKKGQELYEYLGKLLGKAPDKSLMGEYWKTNASVPIVHEYASGDGTTTYQLRSAQSNRIGEQDKQGYDRRTVWGVESKLIPVLHRMTMAGIRIDEDGLDQLITKIESLRDGAKEELGDVNVMSPKQLVAWFTERGVTSWPKTEKGNPSFTEGWLGSPDSGPAGDILLANRKTTNLLTKFCYPIRDKYMVNGRVHPIFHQTRDENFGTITGRLSASDPNVHAQPGKRQPIYGPIFRAIYFPDEGHEWQSGDFAQCEIRIAAHYCGAKVWVDGFNSVPSVDPHTSVSKDIGISRIFAKSINLGLMTGMGKGRLAKELGIPADEATRIVGQYFRGLPELAAWQKGAKNTYQSRGYIRTLLGRRLHIEESKFAYKAVNRLTQGGNADIIKLKIVQVDELLNETGYGRLLLNVHDDLAWTSNHPDTQKLVVECMNDMSAPINLRIPMETDAGNGKNWSEATWFDED